MTKKKNRINSISVNVALTFMLVIALAVAGLISWYCLSGTFFIRGYMGLESVYLSDSPVRQTAAIVLFGFAVCILSFVIGETGVRAESISRYVLYAVSACVLVAGFFYIGEHPYMMDGPHVTRRILARIEEEIDPVDEVLKGVSIARNFNFGQGGVCASEIQRDARNITRRQFLDTPCQEEQEQQPDNMEPRARHLQKT